MENMFSKLIELPRFVDNRGNLTFAEENTHIPFQISRAVWIYDVPSGENREGHAYKETEEFIIALSGSFDVVVDDGIGNEQTFQLNRPYYGLYVPKMIWRQMVNFSTNSVAMILASTAYDADDYVRDHKAFELMKR